MDGLRQFLAQQAKDSGERDRYLELQFSQTTDDLTCEKCKAFRKPCAIAEWKTYEEKILGSVKDAWESEQLSIRMHRKKHDKAVAVLIEEGYPLTACDGDYQIQKAKTLERRFPEEVPKHYVSGLDNLKSNAVRKQYARKARVMAKVRRLWSKYCATGRVGAPLPPRSNKAISSVRPFRRNAHK